MKLTISMTGGKEVRVNVNAVGAAAKDLTRPLQDMGERLVRRIGAAIRGRKLKARSGRLSMSLTHNAGPQRLEVSAGGGPEQVRYAGIQHRGGVIRPKHKKALAIPFPGGPADRRVPLRPSDFANTFVAKGIIFQKRDRASSYGLANARNIVPLFILKKSVRIPAHDYMVVEQSDARYLEKSVGDFIAGRWQ